MAHCLLLSGSVLWSAGSRASRIASSYDKACSSCIPPKSLAPHGISAWHHTSWSPLPEQESLTHGPVGPIPKFPFWQGRRAEKQEWGGQAKAFARQKLLVSSTPYLDVGGRSGLAGLGIRCLGSRAAAAGALALAPTVQRYQLSEGQLRDRACTNCLSTLREAP